MGGMRVSSVIVVAFALLADVAIAQSWDSQGEPAYCAFEVKVSAPSGRPMRNVPVVLLRVQKDVVFETVTDGNGIAKICDVPLAFLDVVVGRDVCGAVHIRRLKFEWPVTKKVFVTFADSPCDHLGAYPERQVLLRVLDEQGHPVVGARLDLTNIRGRGTVRSDAFGRIFRIHKVGESIEGVIVKDKMEPEKVSVEAVDDVDLLIVLRRK